MKTHSTPLSNNAIPLDVETIKENIRKKVKNSLADALIELLDILNVDYNEPNNKKQEQAIEVINQITTFSLQ
jgi:hypothetical protein